MILNVVLAVLEAQEDKVAHYAFINENNVVTEVIAGKDEDEDDIDWEQHYQQFRPGMTCKRTSCNTIGNKHLNGKIPFRKNYAMIGGTYDVVRDAFISPPIYPSWVLNEDTCQWQSPIPYPTDGNVYYWDESLQNWALLVPPPEVQLETLAPQE